MHVTLDQFRRAWYKAHVSHDPNYERDRHHRRWRGTAATAQTWVQAEDRTANHWHNAAINRCLP